MMKAILFIYPLTAMIGMMGYVPQISTLLKVAGVPEGFSLHTWLVWLFTSLVTMIYGIFHLQDVTFSSVAIANFLLNGLVVAIVVYKYSRYSSLAGGPEV